MLTTFPPTACGIATFSAALGAGLVEHGATVDIVRCGQAPETEVAGVRASLDDTSPEGVRSAIDVLNRSDIVLVQHEYGIFAGEDGDVVLDVLDGLRVPSIVVAHTVLRTPTAHQRIVLERVCRAADAVVVMTETAFARLLDGYDVDASKIVCIPHGAATPLAEEDEAGAPGRRRRPAKLLTWGLLGPGKGIEWALDAVATLGDLRPQPTYLIAGTTHPKVREHAGEAYREMLIERAARDGVESMVSFDDTYRDVPALTALIHSADLVILPYDSEDQVTSGVLVDAVAAGRPVVSTAFPHAVELLASGAGLVVPQRDPIALADAIRAVLTDHVLAAGMAAEARRLAPDLSWNAVAAQYRDLATRIVDRRELVA